MSRASFTVCLLAGAISGCSKPNPLFLDTAGGGSEGATQVDTDGGSAGSTSATPTTGVDPTTSEPTTGVDPVTTEPATTSPMTTAGSTSGSTTGGEDFFCEPDPMTGCCAVEILVEADNFLSEARDGTGQPGCPLVANPPPGFETLNCGDWSFGKATELGIFNDFEGLGELEANIHYTHLALRFPMSNGQLSYNGVELPWDVVTDVQIHVPAKVRWDIFSAFGFGVHGLPADQKWVEGVGNGTGPIPCKDSNTSYFCRACGGTPGQACMVDWAGFDPVQEFKGTLGTSMVADANLLVFEGVEPSWLAGSPGGLVLVAFSSTSGNTSFDYVPSGAIIAKARESGLSPRLHLTLCQP